MSVAARSPHGSIRLANRFAGRASAAPADGGVMTFLKAGSFVQHKAEQDVLYLFASDRTGQHQPGVHRYLGVYLCRLSFSDLETFQLNHQYFTGQLDQ